MNELQARTVKSPRGNRWALCKRPTGSVLSKQHRSDDLESRAATVSLCFLLRWGGGFATSG